jgi:hypothetical protein
MGWSAMQRKRSSGKSHKEAMRRMNRRLSDVPYRQLFRDAEQAQTADLR